MHRNNGFLVTREHK